MNRKQSNKLLIGIISGIILAFVGLVIFGTDMRYVKVLGDFFLDALKMIVVPLVLASVVAGVIKMGDVRKIGRVGVKTLGYYLLTTAIAVSLGIFLVTTLQPGVGAPLDAAGFGEGMEERPRIGLDNVILTFVHPNIFDALANGVMLPVIIFSLVLGGIITTMGDDGKPLAQFFDSFNKAIMKFVHLIMYIAPIGIFGLVAAKFALAAYDAVGDSATFTEMLVVWKEMLSVLGKYMGTVLLGLAIHGFVFLPTICFFMGKRNPIRHFIDMIPALLTAWSTASSAATLPLTLECATDRAKIRPRTSGFVFPLGATINMDGTALYEAVAVIFIAQAYQIPLNGLELFLIFITATIVSIGAAAIPEAGLFMMVVVLTAVGLPIDGIGLILVIDWLLDRFRTAVNVWGDSVGAAYIDHAIGPDDSINNLPQEAPA